ncbi:MAG: ATP-grasp domain-containing protein [Marinibacterium sp.]
MDLVRLPAQVLQGINRGFCADLVEFARSLHAEVIIPIDLPSIRGLTAHAEMLSPCRLFPVPSGDILNLLDNKWGFYQMLGIMEVPAPRSALIHSPDDPNVDAIGFPAIVKPLAMGGGIGVYRVGGRGDMYAVLSDWPAGQFPFLMQQFIPGTDTDISLLAQHGQILAWTAQTWEDEDTLCFHRDDEAVDFAARIVADCDYCGVAHIDMRRDSRDGKLYVIECNPRFWGTVDATLATGINFPALGMRVAMGETVRRQEPVDARLTLGRQNFQPGFGARGRIVGF